MNQDNYHGRGIHNKKFLASLTSGHLNEMLKVINEDKNLDVQIRNNYLNIYYNGGNIAKVNSENSVEFDEFYFYLERAEIPKKVIQENKEIVKKLRTQRQHLVQKFKNRDYKNYFEEAKRVMDKWLALNPKPERLEQHLITIENQYRKSDYTIIDLEYQVSTLSDFYCTYIPKGKDKPKKPRFDIVAINKNGKLCVIELKKGTNALSGESGLREHWDCYQHSIGRNYQPFIEEMVKVLEQKKRFNLLDNRLNITKPKPEFMFAYSYDVKDSISEQNNRFTEEYNKIGRTIKVIKLKQGNYKLLD